MKKFIPLLIGMSMGIMPLRAQQERAPMHYFLEYAKLEYADIRSVAPGFPDPGRYTDAKYTDAINRWAMQLPAEWQAFNALPEVASLNPSWTSYGLDQSLGQGADVFENSFWQWYKASGISREKKDQLFPHFPEPVITGMRETDLRNYGGNLGVWMRLYPKEYEAFLNTEELMALVPSRTGKIDLPYMPRFLGAAIDRTPPVVKNTGNPLMDNYEYERSLRNWYFVFDPDGFQQRYGNDYDFPADFDQLGYRTGFIRKIEAREQGLVGDDDNKRGCQKPTTGELENGTELK